MGTQNLKKVPMGTQVPKWGPTWEQCTHLFICWLSFEDEAVAYPKYSQSLQNHLRENPVAKNLVLLTPEQ